MDAITVGLGVVIAVVLLVVLVVFLTVTRLYRKVAQGQALIVPSTARSM